MTPEQCKRVGFLQYLCNKYGDFRICRLWTDKEGNEKHSKWFSVMQCWEDENLFWRMGGATQREILPCEIVLDLDDKPTIKEFNEMCNLLVKYNEKYIGYSSGGKGYHIHIYEPGLMVYSEYMRQLIRKELLHNIFKGIVDPQLYSENVTIGIENTPHRRTGLLKTRLRGNWEI